MSLKLSIFILGHPHMCSALPCPVHDLRLLADLLYIHFPRESLFKSLMEDRISAHSHVDKTCVFLGAEGFPLLPSLSQWVTYMLESHVSLVRPSAFDGRWTFRIWRHLWRRSVGVLMRLAKLFERRTSVAAALFSADPYPCAMAPVLSLSYAFENHVVLGSRWRHIVVRWLPDKRESEFVLTVLMYWWNVTNYLIEEIFIAT